MPVKSQVQFEQSVLSVVVAVMCCMESDAIKM